MVSIIELLRMAKAKRAGIGLLIGSSTGSLNPIHVNAQMTTQTLLVTGKQPVFLNLVLMIH